MSELSNLPSIRTVPPRDSEPADVTEFFDHQLEQHRERALRARRRFFRRRTKVAVVLFVVTCITTFLAGMIPGSPEGALGIVVPVLQQLLTGRWPQLPSHLIWNGLVFSSSLVGILLAHEMGHFLQAVRHRIPATLPFFIPLPIFPFGTMGAVIIQDGGRADRRQLFDIAISGPIAGLIIALPVLWYGISTSTFGTVQAGEMRYGDPLLIRWMVEAVHGPYAPNQDIGINAALFAGWVGIFITALNLLPVGQFDGGHILYTLIGRRAHYVAYAVLTGAVVWMIYSQTMHYALIVLLLFLFGPKHPPTANDQTPLGIGRIILGWGMLAFVIVGFTPTPIMM